MVGHVRAPNSTHPNYAPSSGEFTFAVHVSHEVKEVGGKHFLNETSTVFWDYADIDELSVLDLPGIYEACGGKIKEPRFFWKDPCNDAMSEIVNDEDILSMSIAANGEGRVIELYAFSANDLEDLLDSEVEEMEASSLRRKGKNVAGDDLLGDSDYHEDEDSDYLEDSEEDSARDNAQFAANINQEVEADMGTFDMDDYPELQSEGADYPDSDDRRSIVSSDSDEGDQSHEFRVDRDMEMPTFAASQKFSSFRVLKDAIKQHAFVEKRPVRFKKNDGQRLQVVCDPPCDWYIWASKMSTEDSVQIKKCKVEHSPDCRKTFKVKYATAKFLGSKLSKKMACDRNMKRALLKHIVKEDYKEDVKNSKAWRIRHAAIEAVRGSLKEQYRSLYHYAEELRRSNPNSTVIIEQREQCFNRMYVCFAASKMGFKAGCRQVLIVDGCFLKHEYGGQLLSAVGVDANDQYYPVAFAHVGVENKENWEWFLGNVRDDLSIMDSPGWTFMSDKQKGLLPALDEMFPNCEKRHCARHLWTNLKGACGGGQALKNLFWTAARSTTVAEFKHNMQLLSDLNKSAYDWLIEKPFYHWTRSHFLTYTSCDILSSNNVESWNNSILEERDLGPISMWEGIRRNLMLLIARRQEDIIKWPGPLTEKIEKKLREWEEEAVKWTAISNGRGQFEVKWHDKQVVVNLKSKTCTCRRWELTGIPCQHAIQAIGVGNTQLYEYVANCYTKETAAAIYEHSISPTSGKDYWPQSELGDCGIPPVQNSKKRGRPKKQRRKGLDEEAEAKKKQKKGGREASKPEGKKYKCKVCGALGHNKAFHDPARKQKAEERKKEKEESKRKQQLERAERNRLAALKKLQEKAAKAAASSSSRQPPHVVQLMPDGSSRRPSSQGSQLSQIASQVTQQSSCE